MEGSRKGKGEFGRGHWDSISAKIKESCEGLVSQNIGEIPIDQGLKWSLPIPWSTVPF